MHASIEQPPALPCVQRMGKKDAASQTECCRQVTMTNGRVASSAQPGPSSCPVTNNSTVTADKSLSDYGVKFARGALQAGLQGSNKLIRSVAGFACQHLMKLGQFPVVFPDVKQSLMLLAAMPALASAYSVSTRPACPDGVPGCSIANPYSNRANESTTSYTPYFANSTTNPNMTSDLTSLDGGDLAVLWILLGGMVGFLGACYCLKRCTSLDCCPSAPRSERINETLHCDASDPNIIASPQSVIYRMPAPDNHIAPEPRTPDQGASAAATASTTCTQRAQGNSEQETQTIPWIDESAPQMQPPTYEEALSSGAVLK